MFQDNTHPSLPLLKHGPTIWRPTDGTLDEDGGSILGDTITVADENVLTIHVIDGTMTCGFIFVLVAFEEEVAATIAHVNALAV